MNITQSESIFRSRVFIHNLKISIVCSSKMDINHSEINPIFNLAMRTNPSELNEQIQSFNQEEDILVTPKSDRLSRHLKQFEENYLKKFKRSIRKLVEENKMLVKNWLLYPNKILSIIENHFLENPEHVGTLPLEYFDHIVQSTESAFNNLENNIFQKRDQFLKDFRIRVNRHFCWLDKRLFANQLIFTVLKDTIDQLEIGLCLEEVYYFEWILKFMNTPISDHLVGMKKIYFLWMK